MAFDFNWHDDEHSIVRVDIHTNPAWDEYYQVVDDIVKALKATPHRIDVILNSLVADMPPGSPMPHIKNSAQKLVVYPNMWVMTVVSNRKLGKFAEMIVSIVYRVYRIDTRIIGGFVSSLEEAEEAITRERDRIV